MATSFYILRTLHLPLILLPLSCAYSLQFQMLSFDLDSNITYQGSASIKGGSIELTSADTAVLVGWATYPETLRLWDNKTGKLTDFTSHYSFTIDTRNSAKYGDDIVFFLAPEGFNLPPNSGGGYLGLFNDTTRDSAKNQIVMVEFDSFSNSQWDPPYGHVGINIKSLSSTVTTRWNASFHSGDPADVQIIYNATTKNLSVSWSYQTTSSTTEMSSLYYQTDLTKVLPERVLIGFSASTGANREIHTLHSWEFNSTLNVNESHPITANRIKVIVAVTASAGVIIAAAVIAFAILRRPRQKLNETENQMKLTSIDEDLERRAGPRKFSYNELVLATNNFSEDRKLGEGGFGTVFCGYLTDLDTSVAVKKISRGSTQGKKQYLTEVKVISSLRHRNLVQLNGWCHDSGEFLLVYEFMPNGSLDYHLFDKRSHLDWAVRYKISQGLATALLYLHEEWEQCILHRDIKSSNVMLDAAFNVKLGDFGLARLVDHELSPHTTGLAGTFGYMAPEYISTGKASKESDVYSFGVVALEIATGKKASNPTEENSSRGLVEWVWEMYGTRELLSAVDEVLQQDFDKEQAECLMVVGLWCAHPDYNMRPSIRQALQVLHFDVQLPTLPARMPMPTYNVPTPSISSSDPSITHSLVARS